jgi:hypothetical protein
MEMLKPDKIEINLSSDNPSICLRALQADETTSQVVSFSAADAKKYGEELIHASQLVPNAIYLNTVRTHAPKEIGPRVRLRRQQRHHKVSKQGAEALIKALEAGESFSSKQFTNLARHEGVHHTTLVNSMRRHFGDRLHAIKAGKQYLWQVK